MPPPPPARGQGGLSMRRRTMLQSARPLGALAVLAVATLAVVGAQTHDPKPAFAGQTDAPTPAQALGAHRGQDDRRRADRRLGVRVPARRQPARDAERRHDAHRPARGRGLGAARGSAADEVGGRAGAARRRAGPRLRAAIGCCTSPTSRRRKARPRGPGRSSSSTSGCGPSRSSSAGRWTLAPSAWLGRD